MRVVVIKAFVSQIGSKRYRCEPGQELEQPEGADWLQAGLVEAVAVTDQETAVQPKPATKRERTGKK